MEEEIQNFLEIYARGMAAQLGIRAADAAESAHFASELKQILDPEFVLCCEVARRAGRLHRRRAGHESGAEGHRRATVSVGPHPVPVPQPVDRSGTAAASRRAA